jgi:hypothetical protein
MGRVMRHVFTIVRGAALAALVLSLAAVTAGAAVTGSGAGSGDDHGRDHDHDHDRGSGVATAPPAAAAAPATPPGPAIAPGQGTPPGQAATPGQANKTAPATSTPPADPAAAATPVPAGVPPVVGESMGVRTVKGAIKVRLPRSIGYAPLSGAGSVPPGAVVDARGGTVLLRTAVDAAGHTQAAQIRGAVFEVRQAKDGKGMTDLVLRGGRPQGCPARGPAAIARAAVAPTASSRPRTSSLWARDDHGRFRSRGRNSAATVRGTEWTTTETCAGTVTKVVKGAVDVFDRHTKRTVRMRAGHRYLARDAR